MKQFRYLNSIMIFLFLAALITGIVVIQSYSATPPCDEYLEWCMYEWCPQNNQGYNNIWQCQQECLRKYLEWCS